MYQALTIVHILIAAGIIGLVLLQQGRGADAGAGFGGASNSVFGARGAASLLSRTTAILATLFFTTSLTLAYLAGKKDNTAPDIMDAPVAAQPAKIDLPSVGGNSKPDVPANPADAPAKQP